MTRDTDPIVVLRRTAGHLTEVADAIADGLPVRPVDAERFRAWARQCREAAKELDARALGQSARQSLGRLAREES